MQSINNNDENDYNDEDNIYKHTLTHTHLHIC